MKRSRPPDWQKSAARQLRRKMTDVEAVLWQHLRAHRLDGAGFRRQMPLGPYIVDFTCLQHRTIVELDPEQHGSNPWDIQRDQWLKSQGFKVVRLRERDVMTKLDAVLLEIRNALHQPPPHPSPEMGEGAASHEDDIL